MAEKDTKMSSKEKEELAAYRKEPRYFGYEDYTPSGRAALSKYFEEEKKSGFAKGDKKDTVREKNTPAYSKSAAEKAKQTQKEYADEMKRETRGKADSSEFAKGGAVTKKTVAKKPAPKKMMYGGAVAKELPMRGQRTATNMAKGGSVAKKTKGK